MSQPPREMGPPVSTPGPPPGYVGPPGPPQPPPLSPLPLEPVEYHQMLRTPRARWWKGLLIIFSFVAAYLLLSAVLQGGAIAIDLLRGRVQQVDLQQGKVTLTPSLLLAANLTNAACIPLAMLLQWGFYGQRPRWLHAVTGGFRWRLLARAALVVVPIWFAYILVAALAGPPSGGAGLTTESVVLLVIVLLTTPLQAAGEEYGARGLLTRAAGSWVADSRLALLIGTLVSAGIFMLAHGAGDPWLIGFYFLFGVALSLVTWRTGGLEVAIVIHTVNNVVLFTVSILAGQDLSNALDRSNGSGGPAVLVPLALMAVVVAAVWWWARRTRVTRTFQPGLDLDGTGSAEVARGMPDR